MILYPSCILCLVYYISIIFGKLKFIIQPLTTEYDHKVRAIQISQTNLAEQIDRLSKQLDQCKEEAQFVNVTPYLTKLANSRKRIVTISTTLGHISDRLNRLNKLAKQKYVVHCHHHMYRSWLLINFGIKSRSIGIQN